MGCKCLKLSRICNFLNEVRMLLKSCRNELKILVVLVNKVDSHQMIVCKRFNCIFSEWKMLQTVAEMNEKTVCTRTRVKVIKPNLFRCQIISCWVHCNLPVLKLLLSYWNESTFLKGTHFDTVWKSWQIDDFFYLDQLDILMLGHIC